VFLEVAQQPAGRDARMPARRLPSDKRSELERLDEADVADLPNRCLSDEQVVVLERSLEDGSRVPLLGRTFLLPGAETAIRLYGTGREPPKCWGDAGLARVVPGSGNREHLTRAGARRLKPCQGYGRRRFRLGRGGADAPARSAAVWLFWAGQTPKIKRLGGLVWRRSALHRRSSGHVLDDQDGRLLGVVVAVG
jgi:hypothetical protein